MAKRKQTELMSFKAFVVEKETYLNDGQKLYHATLDSLPGQPKRQAQFFGFNDVFRIGDIHTVTFSVHAGRAKGKLKVQSESDINAEREQAIQEVLDKMEASETVN